jgi:hypothetical protein
LFWNEGTSTHCHNVTGSRRKVGEIKIIYTKEKTKNVGQQNKNNRVTE